MEALEIEGLEEKLQQAMLKSDVPVLNELIADDLFFTMHTGLAAKNVCIGRDFRKYHADQQMKCIVCWSQSSEPH
jgi:hypothetical protein